MIVSYLEKCSLSGLVLGKIWLHIWTDPPWAIAGYGRRGRSTHLLCQLSPKSQTFVQYAG